MNTNCNIVMFRRKIVYKNLHKNKAQGNRNLSRRCMERIEIMIIMENSKCRILGHIQDGEEEKRGEIVEQKK